MSKKTHKSFSVTYTFQPSDINAMFWASYFKRADGKLGSPFLLGLLISFSLSYLFSDFVSRDFSPDKTGLFIGIFLFFFGIFSLSFYRNFFKVLQVYVGTPITFTLKDTALTITSFNGDSIGVLRPSTLDHIQEHNGFLILLSHRLRVPLMIPLRILTHEQKTAIQRLGQRG